MRWSLLTIVLSLGLPAAAQQVGNLQEEIHPRLQWRRCSVEEGCEAVNGELTLDANYRWMHRVDSYKDCYTGNDWNTQGCNSTEDCTNNCALEGAVYPDWYGIRTPSKDSVSLRFRTNYGFAYNVGSRIFLMESRTRYQTFTLRDHELAFDVDLSTVACGINSALYLVPMDSDGGVARYPDTNAAGAEYGTGYCDATCPRWVRFLGGRANFEGWTPSETDEFSGEGDYGACCPQFSVWNGNAHSFAMSTHTCPYEKKEKPTYFCYRNECDYHYISPDERGNSACDLNGCSYNPYRMGTRDFYGEGKTIDTASKFTVATQWTEDRVTQFLVQNGHKFDVPAPVWEGLPPEAGLSRDMCDMQRIVFEERDGMAENGGWAAHVSQVLDQPMVLVLSIGADHKRWNLWLDSRYPPYDPEKIGMDRGDCFPIEENDPQVVKNLHPDSTVVWSNIRYGPIGSTVKVD
ncbi:Exoglucanase 1 [Corynascus novoguineensis]|uniref:Glucanase n=1 Tax=Corynascus novoguineensis TaxID=1126955 RepID=A0AAN7HRG4_9PEZI|nr:Exoglucanase 1 [Corynascus novoguineensis]